jgi:isopentenyl-diphosphate delta-isomerase type 1
MELLDVINEKGKVIDTKDRKQIYIDGNLHRTVHIWVINSNKELLVQKRSPKKDTYPDLWAISTAGHVKAGEASIETALRELKEELGIKATDKDLEYLFSIRRKDDMGDIHINTIDDVYLIEADLDVENTKLQFSELTDIKFVYYEYLEQIFKNKDPHYVPICEEHDKLFKYLHDRFDDHDSIGVLYKTEFEYTYTEHIKFNKIIKKNDLMYKLINIIAAIIILGLIALFIYTRNPQFLSYLFFIIFEYWLFFVKFFQCIVKKLFNDNEIIKNSLIKLTFYQEYFSVKTKQASAKVYYSQIYKISETNDNYYLFISDREGYIITKNNIDSSFNSFIRNKVTCPYHKYGQR